MTFPCGHPVTPENSATHVGRPDKCRTCKRARERELRGKRGEAMRELDLGAPCPRGCHLRGEHVCLNGNELATSRRYVQPSG